MVVRNLLLRILAGAVLCFVLWGSVTGPRADLLHSAAREKSALANAVKIGNPGVSRYPKNDEYHCGARTLWDMHYYDGRVYCGYGDEQLGNAGVSSGPIYVWSFDADGNFTEEFTSYTESVFLFRDYEGKLLVQGSDAMRAPGNFGDIFIKDNGNWVHHKTIPKTCHGGDIALFKGKLYAQSSGFPPCYIHESSDMGQTWDTIMTGYFGQMATFEDFLLIMGGTEDGNGNCVLRYADGTLKTLEIPLFPSTSMRTWSPARLVRFKDGVLYTRGAFFYGVPIPTPVFFLNDFERPLLFLNDFENGAAYIEPFREDQVRDIVVRGESCYVLTASVEGDDEFKGHIYSSSDLKSWIKLAEFSLPALPYSFELLDGTFYVGLGNRNRYAGYADIESGSIYRIEQSDSASDEVVTGTKGDVNGDGKVGSDDAIMVLRAAARLMELTESQELTADMNDDGAVRSDDAILILLKASGSLSSKAL